MTVHNNTEFTESQIENFECLGTMVNNWRQRDIVIYQHPDQHHTVISVGTSFDGRTTFICDEPKESYSQAIKYAQKGWVLTID